MDPNRPTYQDGVLHIPMREGAFASLMFSNRTGNHFASLFNVELQLPEVIFAKARATRSDTEETISRVWRDVPFEQHEQGKWNRGWGTDSGESAVQSVTHDGRGHYEMAVSLLPQYSSRRYRASAVVYLGAGWLPNLARWWEDLFYLSKQ